MKALALDLDGTLMTTDKRLSKRNLDAIIRAQEQGVMLIIASGRPTYGIAPIADRLQLKEFGGYVMAFNGGQIIDWKTEEIIFQKNLDPTLLPRLQKWAHHFDLPLMSYRGNIIITEKPTDSYILRNAKTNSMPVEGVDNLTEELNLLPVPPTKCLMTGEPELLARAEAEMKNDLGDEMEIYRSTPYYLELVPKDIDKGYALSVILERHHLSREDLIACGDSDNDLAMIEFAGMGVAMANAEPPLLAAANYITASNDEDGVAQVIEKFLL